MRRNAMCHTFGNKSKPIFALTFREVVPHERRNNNGVQKFLEFVTKRRVFARRAPTDLEGFLH